MITTKVFNNFPKEAKQVREEVFIHEQGFSYDCDEMDDISTHIVAFEKDEPIAACRVFESEAPGVFILGRLAVKKEYRKIGIGGSVVETAKDYVSKAGGKRLILHSQLQAKGFYEKIGFVEYGGIEYEEDCPHIWMKTEL
ncbi:MAG: GNAT family N-acetyltransferase [Clostridia bacterium]|nr:GNAT family N-acetyltransferase [Clostridia bacterium]